MKRFILTAAVAIAGAQVLAAATAEAAVREETVRCGERPKIERAIEKALKKAKFGDEIKILLVGTCKESPTVAVDNVTIQSKKKKKNKRATVEGTINIVGARRAKVQRLKIRGGGSGVIVREGAIADIIDNDIENNERNGVNVFNGAFATITGNRISGNGRSFPFTDAGISIAQAGVRSRGNRIENNGFAAVRVGALGRFRSGSSLAPDASLNPADRDVMIQRGCGQGQSAGSCGAANTRALDLFSSGIADLRNNDVTGETSVDTGSNLLYRSGTVNGRISMSNESLLGVDSDVFGSGDVNCIDGTTDFYGSAGFNCSSSVPSPP